MFARSPIGSLSPNCLGVCTGRPNTFKLAGAIRDRTCCRSRGFCRSSRGFCASSRGFCVLALSGPPKVRPTGGETVWATTIIIYSGPEIQIRSPCRPVTAPSVIHTITNSNAINRLQPHIGPNRVPGWILPGLDAPLLPNLKLWGFWPASPLAAAMAVVAAVAAGPPTPKAPAEAGQSVAAVAAG